MVKDSDEVLVLPDCLQNVDLLNAIHATASVKLVGGWPVRPV